MMETELAMQRLLPYGVVAGEGGGGNQRRNVPALDVVQAAEALLAEVGQRRGQEIGFHQAAGSGIHSIRQEVVAPRQTHDEVGLVQRLIGGLAAPAAEVGAIGAGGMPRVVVGIAGQDRLTTPQAALVAVQPPAQRQT